LRADCPTAGYYYVTMTWQQIFKGVTVVAFWRLRLLNADILAGNATRQLLPMGKLRSFAVCKEKHK